MSRPPLTFGDGEIGDVDHIEALDPQPCLVGARHLAMTAADIERGARLPLADILGQVVQLGAAIDVMRVEEIPHDLAVPGELSDRRLDPQPHRFVPLVADDFRACRFCHVPTVLVSLASGLDEQSEQILDGRRVSPTSA
jgi:hypothetical protein